MTQAPGGGVSLIGCWALDVGCWMLDVGCWMFCLSRLEVSPQFFNPRLQYPMELTRTAYGTWSGGRFMHFGEPLSDERFLGAIRHAYERVVRTFMTADGNATVGADEMLCRALAGV